MIGHVDRALAIVNEEKSELGIINRVVEDSMRSLAITITVEKRYVKKGAEIVILPHLFPANSTSGSLVKLSRSEVHDFSVGKKGSVKSASLSVAQFNISLSKFNKLLPAPNQTTGPKTLLYTLSESSPLLSITAFDPRNYNKIDVDVTFSIDISADNLLQPELRDDVNLVESLTYNCAFFNTTTRAISKTGCSVVSYVTGSSLTCKCDHTTLFAALMSFTTVRIPKGVKICTYVTETMSVLSLIAVCIILHKVRKLLRSDRTVVQICLSASLAVMHSFNLLHDIAFRNDTACEFVTVLTHYFLLSSAMWMLMEGITIAMKTTNYVMRYSEHKKKIAIARHMIGWGFPAAIVICTAAVGFTTDTYMNVNPIYKEHKRKNILGVVAVRKFNFCWLHSSSLLGAVIIPFAVILFVNAIVIVRMTYVICQMTNDTDEMKPSSNARAGKSGQDLSTSLSSIKSSFKFYLLFLPVLGIPWATGFLVAIEDRTASVAFMYVNALLNGLQGVFLLIIYCAVTSETREAATGYWKRKIALFENLYDTKSYDLSKKRERELKSMSVEEARTITGHRAQQNPKTSTDSKTEETTV